MDYVDQLNEEEKAWLDKFVGEFQGGGFNAAKPENNLHQEKHKKELYDRNNAQNRDLYGRVKAKVANTHILNYEDRINMVEAHIHAELPVSLPIEDVYVDYLTNKQLEEKEMIREYRKFMRNFTEESG